MKLRVSLSQPVAGYWDGGERSEFDFTVQWSRKGRDEKGEFVHVGSYCANYWFYVSVGKTEKATLANARRKLKQTMRLPEGVTCQFRYID